MLGPSASHELISRGRRGCIRVLGSAGVSVVAVPGSGSHNSNDDDGWVDAQKAKNC